MSETCKLGFGFMRLPLNEENNSKDIDYESVNGLVDTFINEGGYYFDTGYQYHGGNSETAIRECVIKRYPRESVMIADKMPIYAMKSTDDPDEIFNTQLERCGVTYFDYYLVHNTADVFYNGVCKQLKVFDYLRQQQREGKIRKLGVSHHDTPEVLESVIRENPEIEFVQLQLNYVDWTSTAVRAMECYEVARKYDLEVIVMEPLKGGTLAHVPDNVSNLFYDYNNMSPVYWALSFLLNLDGVEVILSGMGDESQLCENLEICNNFRKFDECELSVIDEARNLINDSVEVACTYCDYCAKYCPMNIPISKYFSLYNDAKQAVIDQMLQSLYYDNYAKEFEKASSCIECSACENVCPQHLNIIDELKNVVEKLET